MFSQAINSGNFLTPGNAVKLIGKVGIFLFIPLTFKNYILEVIGVFITTSNRKKIP